MSTRQHGEEIFDRYFDPVYSYIAYRLAGDHETAQDLTQEVFLAAFQSRGTFRRNSSVLSWLRAIARNKVVDHFRALNRRGSVQWSAPESQTEAPEATTAAGKSERQERAVVVSVAMREISADYARLLEEKYLEGSRVKAIAEDRGITEKAVESALTRARAAFRQAYKRLQERQAQEERNP